MGRKLANRIMEMTPSATVELAGKVAQLKHEGVDILSFSVGEPDFNTPKNICEMAKKAIDEGKTKYTAAAGIIELRESICKKLKDENGLNYSPDEIIVSTGAKQALYNTFMAICNPGDEVILPTPAWVSYIEMIKFAGGVPVLLPCAEENGFQPDLQELKKAITDKTVAILFNSPNNPTGAVYGKETLMGIAEIALEKNLYVIADEIYEHLIYDGAKHYSIVNLCPELKELCIVINGPAKTYAMTGWRTGYAAASKEVIKAMSGLQGHMTSNATTVAQYATIECAYGPQDEVAVMKEEYAHRRRYMIDKLNSMPGVKCIESKGAFYTFPKVSELYGGKVGDKVIANSGDLATFLLEDAHIAIVPGVAFQAPEYVRLTYASSMENIITGLDAMAASLAKIKFD